MATVRDMIRRKGTEVFTIAPEATVFEALNLMAEHNIGALLVMSGDEHLYPQSNLSIDLSAKYDRPADKQSF